MTTYFDDQSTQSQSSSSQTSTADTDVYARLLSLNPKFPNIDLRNKETVVGRKAECCDVVFNEPQVSGKHCIILPPPPPAQMGMLVKDLSSNGTFVNGKKIGRNNSRLLKSGDHISFVTNKLKTSHFMSYIMQDIREDISGVQTDDIYKTYEILHELGRGNFSVVKFGVNIATREACAIKIVNKRSLWSDPKTKEQIVREVQILKTIQHPNCVQYKGLFEGEKFIYIVLEYAAGGELFDKIVNGVSEPDARILFTQLLRGVSYLHNSGIAHRDLKPENILLDKEGNIKISDFGLARFNTSQMQSLCGTPHYVAPEVIRLGQGMLENENPGFNGYGKGVDMWSLGVSLYHMLTSQLPFLENDRMLLFQKIESGQYHFPDQLWSGISEEAKDLVRMLLDTNPKTRITAEQALKHPWIKNVKFPAKSTIDDSVPNPARKRSSVMVICSSESKLTTESKENKEPRKKIRLSRSGDKN